MTASLFNKSGITTIIFVTSFLNFSMGSLNGVRNKAFSQDVYNKMTEVIQCFSVILIYGISFTYQMQSVHFSIYYIQTIYHCQLVHKVSDGI